MSHGDRVTEAAQGLRGARHLGERADRHHRRREAQVLRRAVPSRGRAHAARRRLLRNFVRKIAGCSGDWTMRAFREEAIEKIRAGRQGPRHLRALGRRRFRGRRGAAARGDRRPAHLRLRRSRPDARSARRRRSSRCSATTTTSRSCMWMRRKPSSMRSRVRSRGQAQDHRQALHRRLRGGSEENRQGAISWRRARSIPT
jgi:hypothetical protein